MSGAGRAEVFTDLPRLLRAQRDRAADGAQPARGVVAAQDEELRAGEGAGDRADDRFRGVAPSLVK
ncbi:hypothetical protein ACFWJT_23380 [Streptomyces sp. NPDC127069]|uniref:hypothetical protein n=1 Tax=Streptomyces sp. NPDC127069 TaxID=3347128 RepID=UPI003662CD46